MSVHTDRYSFPPLGAYIRPGEVKRGARALHGELTRLVVDAEAYFHVLKSVQEDLSEEERATEPGRAVDSALDAVWVMLGVLRGALSLFPHQILSRPESDSGA